MRVSCPHCQAGYDFPVELLAGPDVPLRCTACFGPFEIGPEGVRAPAAPAPPATPTPMLLPRLAPSPTGVGLARLTPRALPAAPAPPDSGETPPAPAEESPPPGEGSEPGGGGFYMVLRGGSVHETTTRRRVAIVPRTSSRAPPPARLVPVKANCGRVARVRPRPVPLSPASPEGNETPPPEPAPSVAAAPSPRWPWALAAAALVAAATVGATLWLVERRASAESEAASLVSVSPGPSEPAPSLAPPPPSGEPRLVAAVTVLEPMPGQRALLLHGHVFNGTSDSQTAVRLRAELFVDGVIERRREVWCCEDLSVEDATRLLQDPSYFRVTKDPDPKRVKTLEPNTDEPFSVLFPAVDEATLARGVTGEIRMTEALRLQTN